ncbi:UPF0246 protein YaaA [Micrococcus lylae]|uniref:UPF0246 protein YaaA n=1 Tax=Micrococcus lylae TaxID=1273 RepID=A0A1R4J534_9MICC|nr:UPF0246 protein YaaA [Micrococcus lylae]
MDDVLILLPPSEGKTAPASGRPLDLSGLVLADDPEVTAARTELLDRLARVSGREDALEVLGVGASLAAEVEANRTITQNPAAAAHRVYTGVLFDALDYASLPTAARTRARRRALVFSALLGVTALGDAIPAYRLSVGARLPDMPGLGTWWKKRLTPALDAFAEEDAGPVVDCRSGGYASQWKAPSGRTVTVDVFQMKAGRRTVVSHFAKHTRGLVARELLAAPASQVRTLEEAVAVVERAGSHEGPHDWSVELVEPTVTKAGSLQVVLPER